MAPANSSAKMAMMRPLVVPLCGLLAVAGTGWAMSAAPKADPSAGAGPTWQSIITRDDRTRLRGWRTAWTRGLAQARAAGHSAEIVKEGILLNPDAAIDWKDPLPGTYRCRTIKIGAKSEGLLDYVAYPPFDCRIRGENGFVSFTKLTGSQRPIGLIMPYVNNRMIFLGTLQLSDETRALEYGRDRERDLAAIIERIDEHRWRLVFPYPHFESTLDVMDIVPKPSS